jgi:predicted enzyme related to lactoylglutathione lyase
MVLDDNDGRIDYVEIPVDDVAAAKRFYAHVFGWSFTDYGPDYTTFLDGRLSGGLVKSKDAGGRGVLLVVYAIDLDAAQAVVTAAGGRVVRATFEFPGGRRFHFLDPSGNELAVWSDH